MHNASHWRKCILHHSCIIFQNCLFSAAIAAHFPVNPPDDVMIPEMRSIVNDELSSSPMLLCLSSTHHSEHHDAFGTCHSVMHYAL